MDSQNIANFIPLLGTQDTKKKLQLGTEIISYLEDQNNSLDTDDLGMFIDGVAAWLNSSNFKICMYGLEILGHLIDRMKEDFRPYTSAVLSATVDRLGDNKDQVRDQGQLVIQKLMHQVSSPQLIFDKLMTAVHHKSWRVREEIMICLQKTLETHGANSLSLSKYVPYIVKLLSDPASQVRDASLNALVEIYRHVGDRVKTDLQKKYNIPQARLQTIFAKFDEVRDSGQMLAIPNNPVISSGSGTTNADAAPVPVEDEIDRAVSLKVSNAPKRASSAPPVRRAVFSASKPPANTAGPAGAVDEETFIRSFEDVPKVQLFSVKDLEDTLQKCREVLVDPSNDWEKRAEAMRRVRGLVVAGGAEYEELIPLMRAMELPFQISVKDLRSQIVREACITIAYFSQQLCHKMDHFAEVLLPSLINLIPNSAKVMSTAGIVAIRFIIRYTFTSRLIPIITANMTSKSKDIRRQCCEFLDQLLHTWPTHSLERHIAILQEAIKKGISDADPEARASSRKAFWGFADHFQEQADSLLNSLDTSKQRMLQGQMSLSNSSSNNSLNNIPKISRTRVASSGGSTENLSRVPSFKRNVIPLSSPRTEPGREIYGPSRLANGSLTPTPMRSNSAIDLNAVQRARARATYAAASRLKVGSGASLPRPLRKLSTGNSQIEHQSYSASAVTSPERATRSRTKLGSSQSQPSSRSGSPSSRLSYSTYGAQMSDSGLGMPGRTRRRSGNIHSTGTSRETSPTRTLYSGHERRLSGSGLKRARTLAGSDRATRGGHVIAQRILTQSKEAEVAVADALVSPLDSPTKGSLRRRYDPFGNESDDSETSSVCSERSYGSYGRPIDDVAEVINNLASQHWADRKEGLMGLQALVNSNRTLTASELKKVTDIFTKMFMDPHTKVFSIFLDTLRDLIITHKLDLEDWLYVLLTRLFNKQGVDLLGSVHSKLQRTLDTIRESFTYERQFNVLMRFLVDQTQTPNIKVKLAVLNYLQILCQMMNPSDFIATAESQASVSKIIAWTTDPKSAEMRKASQTTVIALFNTNTPEFTKLLSQLPKNCQDNAAKLLHNHLKRATSDDSPLKVSPISTIRTPSGGNKTRSARLANMDDTENMNPDEVWNNLRRTTTEIQNYSFDTLDHGFTKERKERFERDRDTTSQDSGISQMSAPDGRMDILEESPENGSPTRRKDYNPALYQDKVNRNGYEKQNCYDKEVELVADSKDRVPAMTSILSELANYNKRFEERKLALNHLSKLAREDSTAVWDEHFKAVLRTLLETLIKDSDGSLRALSLRVLCEMVRKQTARFQGFAELTILKILEAHKDGEKDVVRAAEVCAGTLAGGLQAEQCVRVLIPIILTGDYPMNQAAIKMLTKVIELQPKSAILQFIGDIMPGLIKAYDNQESSVRKAAVFCMVAANAAVGEALKPYLAELNGSKLKLLNLYIKRSQPQGSSPTSPQHSSSSHDGSPRT